MEFFKKVTAFPFMRTRKLWYAVSAVLIVLSFVGLFARGLNLGVDFTGGLTVSATYPDAADIEAIREHLERAGFREPQVTQFGSSRDVLVRLPPVETAELERTRAAIESALRGVDPQVQILSSELIGPQIGSELQESAAWALFFTMLLIFIYVALRFHTWKLSVGAILAALHDPILVLGFFAWSQLTFDLPVIAAILAVVGYSLNDTVVIFDRIRERFQTVRRLTPEQVLDQSTNQTLSRTIMTSGTTLIVVATLLLLGGPALQGFSAALFVGIVVGTYSSIYIAGAAALDFGLEAKDLFPPERERPTDTLP